MSTHPLDQQLQRWENEGGAPMRSAGPNPGAQPQSAKQGQRIMPPSTKSVVSVT